MRTVDLALFADVIAARTAAVEARLERARDRIRQAAIEREARRTLPNGTVERLEQVGALSAASVRAEREEVVELAASLAALRELQGLDGAPTRRRPRRGRAQPGGTGRSRI